MRIQLAERLGTTLVVATSLLIFGCEAEPASAPLKTGSVERERSPSTDPHADPHGHAGGDPHAGIVMPEKKTAAEQPLDSTGGELALDEATFTAPAGWGRKEVGPGGFIDAEYVLPKAEGDDADGRLTVSRAGGSLEANIDRWRGQFGGTPEKDASSEIDVDGVKVTIVDLAGEFNDQRGPFAPPTKKKGYRMLAAILPIGAQPYFVKATGPQNTIEGHSAAIMEFVKSAKAKK